MNFHPPDTGQGRMSKKSILVISHEFPPLGGGAGLNLQSLCKELVTRGYSFRLITELPPRGIVVRHPFPVTFVRCLRRSNLQTSFISTAIFLAGAVFAGILIKRTSFGFVFSNMAVPAGIAGAIIAALHRLPHVVWHHGSDVHAGRSHGAPLIQKLVLKTIWKGSIANCFVSEGLLARAQTYGPVPKACIVPVAPVIKSPTIPHTEPERPFLFLARMEKVKNPLLLIDACAVLKKRGLLIRKIIVAGDGSLYGTLQKHITAYGLEHSVFLQKNVRHDRVSELLQSSYALIITSVVEGFNMTMLEAALFRVPAIASDVAAINDFIKHQSTGLLFRENDPEELASCMQKLDKDPALRNTLGINAFNAAKRYTIEAAADKLENALGGAL